MSGLRGVISGKRRRIVLLAQLTLVALGVALAAYATLVTAPVKPPAPAFVPAAVGDVPPGAVVLAHEDGTVALALAIKPSGSHLLLVATAISSSGTGAAGLRSSFAVTTHDGKTSDAAGIACGAGCYEATIPTSSRPTRASVTLIGGGSTGKPIAFAWPRQPQPGSALVRDAEAAYKKIKSLVTYERLASSPTVVLYTTYRAVAPGKLFLDTRGIGDSIIIGGTRWDRRPGKAWVRSPQTPIRPISPDWTPLVTDATILGSATIRGHSTWVVSFANPQIPAFFTIWLDKTSHHVLQLHMTAASHFMIHEFGPFDSPITIVPPK
jgi:hypothetical protein